MDFLKAAAQAAQEQSATDFFKAAAQAAHDQVNELKMGAFELAEDISGYTEALVKGDADGNKEVEFGEGPLGFRLEGTLVISVDPGSQADCLGVEAGDRLAAVAGYQVPEFGPDDVEGEQRAMKLVKKWLKEMPRPSTLTFVPVLGAEEDSGDDDESGQAPATSSSAAPAAAANAEGRERKAASPPAATAADVESALGPQAGEPSAEDMQALVRLAAEWQQQEASEEAAQPADLQALRAELLREQEERKQLNAELRRARHARAQANASLEALQATHQKKLSELQAQLSSAREENRKALLAASAGEADSFTAMEASEAREGVLEEEVARLRQALEAAGQAAAEAAAQRAREVEELASRADAAEDRARAEARRAEGLTRELRGFCEAHEAELELLRGERAELARQHERRVEELERRRAEEEERLARELAEAKQEAADADRRAAAADEASRAAASEAAAAAVEAAAARMEAAAAAAKEAAVDVTDPIMTDIDLDSAEGEAISRTPSAGASSENLALYERIDMLEKRCCTLQKKLNARPVVFQSPLGADADDAEYGGAAHRPSWELGVVSVAGPRAGAVAVALHLALDTALRNFTKRLLKRDAWLWIFYAHLVILYAIAASSYTETLPLFDGSTADIQLKQEAGAPRPER